jgi:hypothetical protein
MQDLHLAVRALRHAGCQRRRHPFTGARHKRQHRDLSLLNSLLLRSLPVTDPQRLVTISTGPSLSGQEYSYAVFDQIRQHGEAFDGALAWAGLATVTLTHVARRRSRSTPL